VGGGAFFMLVGLADPWLFLRVLAGGGGALLVGMGIASLLRRTYLTETAVVVDHPWSRTSLPRASIVRVDTAEDGMARYPVLVAEDGRKLRLRCLLSWSRTEYEDRVRNLESILL
jgi:hypothetical protein